MGIWRTTALVAAVLALVLTSAATATSPEAGDNPTVTIDVDPSDNLAASQNVQVTGAGYANNDGIDIEQCAATGPCKSLAPATANASGGFFQTVTVTRAFSPDGGGAVVDCLATACVVQATNNAGSRSSHHHLTFAGPPAVTTSAATGVGSSTATLNATVETRGLGTEAWFEYSTAADLAQATSTPHKQVAASPTPVTVTQDLTGLAPDATFYFRAVASRGGTVARGDVLSFKTNATGDPGGPSGPSGPDPSADTTAPIVVALSVVPGVFPAARSGPSTAARTGASVTYELSEAARAVFTVQRATRGIRRADRCRRRTAKNRTGRRCTRWVRVRGSITKAGSAGVNRFRMTGRLRNRSLRPGRYRLRLIATDAAGNRSRALRRPFRIKRAR